MSEVFNFDFDKLQKQGISKEATLNFLKTKTENNFNFDELENTFKSNGYTQEQITNAMYHSLQEASKSGDLWLRPLPKDDVTSGNHSADFVDSATTADNTQNNTTSSGLRSTQSNLTQNHSMILQSENPQADTQDSKILQDSQATQETTSSGSIVEIESGLYEPSARSLLNINDEARGEVIADYSPQDNADSKGFFEGILEGIGYETDNVKAINAEADRLLRESVANGKELKDLSGTEKRRLYELYNDNKGFFDFDSMEASLQKEYNRLKEKQNIAQIKDPKDLTQEQREIIAQDLGAIQNTWNYLFVDEKDTLKEWQDNYKAQSEILPQTQKAIAFLDNIHKHKSISNIIESAYKGEMNKEAFEDYLNEVEAIATTAGFDEIGYNKKGELYFYKGENAYKVNQGFFDNFTNILSANAGSISGGISGAIAGAKLGKTPQTAMAGAILGGGAGAFLGGGADVLITNAYLNRENNLDELIRHATEEGAMSIVGDVAIAGIVKYGGKALNKAKDMPLGKLIDYTPILGFAKRAVDGNASSAQKLIDKTYTQEQMLSLKEAGESFGANLSFNGEKGKNPFKSTFGEDSSFAKSYDFLQNALSLPTQRARQQEFIQAIRADESGQLLAFLSEASAQSPKAYDNMRSILNATSFQVKKQLDNLNLNKGDIKAVFDELESGTKQSYDEAINKIIGGIYNDSYKVNLNELKREVGKPIQQDLESVESAILFEKGRENPKTNKGFGAKHILKHTKDTNAQGYITDLELVNLGKSIREYLAKHKEPFIDTNGARLYEWENKEGVRFRAVVGDIGKDPSTTEGAKALLPNERIITFYSDRNLKDKMQFKNPELEKQLPTKSNLEKDLTQQEIKETIDKWDLSKPSANDKLIVSKVEQDELELLKKYFDFKGNYAVVREIDAEHLAHALNRHSDEFIETSRNQIPITKDEILDYQSIIKTHDTREVSGNNITYKKQINGHYVAVEEVLTGKNKLRFVTMWKSKGNITTAPTPSSKGYDLDRTLSGSYDKIDSTTNKIFNQGEIKFDNAQSFLEKIPADIAPSTFTKQEIEKLLTQFDNIENLTQHLNTRADSQARQELFHLLESTKNNPNIHYTKDSKDKYLKRFKDNDEHDPYFYLLITKDKDKTFITHLKTRDLNYLEKEILNAESIIKGADIIGDFRQQAGSAKHKSPTSTADSTTNKIFNQGDIKFDSLENFTHFAKLSGFENLPQEKLQSAHKYILQNLHKLEC